MGDTPDYSLSLHFLAAFAGFALARRLQFQMSVRKAKNSEEWVAPIFILADDDRQATQRILERLHDEWFYVPVSNSRQVVRYAKRFATTAVFLAVPMNYPRGGARALLQQLRDEVAKPVVVMVESLNPEVAERWRKIGAADCIAHPTRFEERMKEFRAKIQELAIQAMPG
jgi:DNA-binding NtrC family response regulator